MKTLVTFERIDRHVALVTLDRPEKRNAINREMTLALRDAVRAVEDEPDIRVAVLASSNDAVFCAGADLATVAAGGGDDLHTPTGGFAGFVYEPRTKPWIAAAAGAVLAGGLELCLACDLIVVAEHSRFGLPEVKRGLVAAAGGVTRLPRAIPRAVALEMLLTGEPIGAERAFAIGLVNHVVPGAALRDTALALATTIAGNAPIAVREALSLGREAVMLDEEEGRRRTDVLLSRLRLTEDFAEGPRAFTEKRPPVWTGR